jgi:hypothetical protein
MPYSLKLLHLPLLLMNGLSLHTLQFASTLLTSVIRGIYSVLDEIAQTL